MSYVTVHNSTYNELFDLFRLLHMYSVHGGPVVVVVVQVVMVVGWWWGGGSCVWLYILKLCSSELELTISPDDIAYTHNAIPNMECEIPRWLSRPVRSVLVY